VSAQRFRQKRKSEFEQLKDTMNDMKKENNGLKSRVQELTSMLKH